MELYITGFNRRQNSFNLLVILIFTSVLVPFYIVLTESSMADFVYNELE